MCETRLKPGGGTRADRSSVAVVGEADSPAKVAGPTPARILAQLAQDPGPAPVGFTIMTGEDMTLGRINRGDYLGINGRWCRVMVCTALNGWVSVETPAGYPSIAAAFRDVPIHLARQIDLAGVAV